jgi:hypothetical protein
MPLTGGTRLIVNSSALAREKITVLATVLKHFDPDNIYIRPVVGELLNEIPDRKPFYVSIDAT